MYTPIPSNRAPTDLVLSKYDVEENQDEGTEVGTLSTTDPDVGDSHTYTLVSGMEYFSIVGNILQTADKFDFEQQNTYRIAVRTTDNGGLSFEKSFTIEVINVNEPPVLTPIGSRSVTVGNILIFTANAKDEDGNALIFSLSGAPTDAGIDPRTGEFSWTPSSTGIFNVTVIVTETDGHPTNLSDDQAITITVVPPPLPEPPTSTPLRPECQEWDHFYFLNLKPEGVLDLTHSTDDVLQVYVDGSRFGGYVVRYHPLGPSVEPTLEDWPIIWQCEEPQIPCPRELGPDQEIVYVDWEWLRKDMVSGWYSLVLQVFIDLSKKRQHFCTELMPVYIKIPEVP